MLPVRAASARPPARRDPAPSRLRYRLNRLWLRPGFRRLVNFGVPMLAGVLASWTVLAQFDVRGAAVDASGSLRDAIVADQPATITYPSPKSEAVLAEDQLIGAHKLGVPAAPLATGRARAPPAA